MPRSYLVCRPHMKLFKWISKTKINKEMYQFNLKNNNIIDIPYKFFNKWECLLDIPLPWEQVFQTLYKTTLDNKTRYFQFRLIYKYLETKKMLYIWGIESSPNCRFCQEEEETIEHLFWYCSTAGLFWLEVQKWLIKYNIQLNIDMFIVLLGNQTETEDIQNIIILLGKMFLFNSKDKSIINIDRFKNDIKLYCKIERTMAYETKKFLYVERWTKIIEAEHWE